MTAAAQRMSTELQAANAVLVGTAAASVGAVTALSLSASSLEDSLARLSTVTRSTSATVETSLAKAETAAREFSSQFTATAGEFIDAQFQIATSGVDVEQQISATGAAFKLARATVGEFTQSAQLLGSFLNTFGKSAEFNYLRPAEKVEAITDRLTTAVQRFQVTLPVLAESFKFIIGPAAALNLNLGEVTAALGVLNTAGFRGTLAGTALSNVFNKIDNVVEKLDLNPDKFIDLSGNLKDLTSFFEELNRALADSTPIEKQTKLIGALDIRAGRVIKTLLDNIDALKQFRGELDISTGATDALAKKVESTTSSQFKKFFNQIQNIATIIGNSLNKTLGPLAMKLNEVARGFAIWLKSAGPIIPTTLAVVASFLSLAVAAGALRLIFGTLFAGLGQLIAQSTIWVVGVGALRIALTLVTATTALFLRSIQAVIIALSGNLARALLNINVDFTRFIDKIVIATRALTAFVARGVAAAVARLGLVGAAIVGVTVAVSAAAVGLAYLAGEFDEVADATKNSFITLDELDRKYGNTIKRTASVVAELKRLGTTLRDSVNIPLRTDEVLGKLPFADKATQDLRNDSTIGRTGAIEKRFNEVGSVGVIDQIAEKIGLANEKSQEYVKRFNEIKAATDRTFSNDTVTDKVNNIKSAFEQLALSGESALVGIANGNTEAAKTLGILLDTFDKLDKAGEKLSSQQAYDLRLEGFDAAKAGLDQLRDSTLPAVKNIVSYLDEAQSLAKKVNFDQGTDFKFAEKIKDGFKELENFPQDITSFLRVDVQIKSIAETLKEINFITAELETNTNGVKTAIAQTQSGIKSSVNVYKRVAAGTESYANAQKIATQRVKEAEDSYAKIANAIATASSFLDTNKGNELIDKRKIKDLQDFVDSGEDIRIGLQFDINEQKAIIEANKTFALISESTGKLSLIQESDIKSLASSFGETINQTLSGSLKGDQIFTSLADSFKKNFIGQIQVGISQILGSKFNDQLRTAITVAEQVTRDFEISGILEQGIQDGSLGKAIADKLNQVAPDIQKKFGDIFSISGDNKLQQTFKDIFTDASVSLVTAGGQSAAILERLQDVIGQGPGKGAQELTKQAGELRSLLLTASTTGAGDAIRPIQDALSATLKQLQGIGETSGVSKFAASAETVKTALDEGASNLSNVVNSLATAGKTFFETVKSGFTDLFGADLSNLSSATIDSLSDAKNNRKIEIDLGDTTSTLSVSITGTGGGTINGQYLEEDEIRSIIEAARKQLEQEVDSKLTRLEDEIRNR